MPLQAPRRLDPASVSSGRRRVLRALALGAAAACPSLARAIACPFIAEEGGREKAPAGFALRYILASSLYGKTKLAEILPEVSKTGAEEIDLWPERHANQREQVEAMGHEKFVELLRAHGVRLGMTRRLDRHRKPGAGGSRGRLTQAGREEVRGRHEASRGARGGARLDDRD